MAYASAASLFPQPPVLAFAPTQTHCSDCQASLKTLKTRRRSVVTMHAGPFVAYETFLHCTNCDNDIVYDSQALNRLVAEHCTFGYDVLVYVGKAMFLRHRNSQEIRVELTARNVHISTREIDYLGRRFIIYLAIAHRRCAPKIKEAMQAKGGYMLHLDGMCEGASPHLMSGMDSVSEVVLGNVKLPSENSEQIIPFLRDIQNMFGDPLATIHDMGSGILKAVAEVFPDAADFICHFHFLRDLGNDLLEQDYTVIRKRLKKHKVAAGLRKRARAFQKVLDVNPDLVDALHAGIDTRQLPDGARELAPVVCAFSLVHWALDGKKQGRGYGFPFDRPHLCFVKRLYNLHEQLQQLEGISLRGEWRDNKPFLKLIGDLKKVVSDTVLRKAMTRMESKAYVFDELREAMRIAPKAGKDGLNSDGMDADMKTIKQGVTKFRQRLTTQPFDKDKGYKKMIAQLDKYWEKLFADPIVVQTPDGPLSLQPQRTNNILEHLFRGRRKANRRRTGNNRMSKTLQTMLADTPLVKNLENAEYMRVLLGDKVNLEELFAEIEGILVRTELRQAQETLDKLPAKIRKLIANPTLPELIMNMFRNTSRRAAEK